MAFFGKKTPDEKLENISSEEKNMNEFQENKNSLDYTKVNSALNLAKKPNSKGNDFDSLKSHVQNFSKVFEQLAQDKKQEALKSDMFKKLFDDINSLNNSEIKKIVDSMYNQRELSEYDRISKQIEDLTSKLSEIEKETLIHGKEINDIASYTEKIPKVINESFWSTLKQSIPTPKLDFASITQKIESIKNDLNNSNRELAKKIDDIKLPTFPKIPNDYLKQEDFEFTINDKLKGLKEIKESSENLETVPAKVNSIEKEIKSLSEKLDNLPSSNGSKPSKHIPKEEKSVVDLAKYMTDGVAQFENIAKEYISKINDLEKLDNIKEEHLKELEKAKKDEFKNGKKVGQVELIKRLAEDFPTEFKALLSVFEVFLEEKFEKDEILEINDGNKNELIVFIEGNIDNGKYKVLSPALLIDGETLIKATLGNNVDGDEKEES